MPELTGPPLFPRVPPNAANASLSENDPSALDPLIVVNSLPPCSVVSWPVWFPALLMVDEIPSGVSETPSVLMKVGAASGDEDEEARATVVVVGSVVDDELAVAAEPSAPVSSNFFRTFTVSSRNIKDSWSR